MLMFTIFYLAVNAAISALRHFLNFKGNVVNVNVKPCVGPSSFVRQKTTTPT